MLCNNLQIQFFFFILSLDIQGRLPTKDRLQNRASLLTVCACCVIRTSEMESVQHLFFV